MQLHLEMIVLHLVLELHLAKKLMLKEVVLLHQALNHMLKVTQLKQ